MRPLATVLTVLASCSLGQGQTAAINPARHAFDAAQEILKTRPNNFPALVATITQFTSIKPAPAPADLEAAEKAAELLLYDPAIFAVKNNTSGVPAEDWAKLRDQTKPLAEGALISIDALRKKPRSTVDDLNRESQGQKMEPQYSEEARLAGLEGRVLVSATITGDGVSHDLHVSRGLGLGLDEQAVAAVAELRSRPGSVQTSPPRQVTIPVDFALRSKRSHWHLANVTFHTAPGVSRPTFAQADYPLGSGIGVTAYDEAGKLAASGLAAMTTVSFDIDESGVPGHFQVVRASPEVWGPEAVTLIQNWRFHPGMQAGRPVSVPCTLRLVWGNPDADQIPEIYPSSSSPKIEHPPAPKVLVKQEPAYTDAARQAGIEGTVVISLNVDEQGAPHDVRAVGGLKMGLDESAREAISQWLFEPAPLNAQAAVVPLVVQVNFKLLGTESSIFTRPVAGKPKQ